MKLLDIFIDYSVRNIDQVVKSFAQIKTLAENVTTAMNALGRMSERTFNQMNSLLGGMVRQGIAASNLGQLLSFRMQEMARVVAGLWGPEIRGAIGLLGQFTNYLRGLNEAQRETLAQWVKWTAAGTLVTAMLPKLMGGLRGLATLFIGAGVGNALSNNLDAITAAGERMYAALSPFLKALGQLFARLTELILPVGIAFLDVLTPAIQKLTAWLDELTRSLDSNTMKWVAAIAAAGLFVLAASKILAAVKTIITGLKALTAANIVAQAMSGPAGWASIAAGIAIAAGAVYTATKVFEGFEGAVAKANKAMPSFHLPHLDRLGRMELPRRAGGSEALEETFFRINRASVNAGFAARTPQQEMVDQQKEANDHLRRIRDEMARRRPPLNQGVV